jgi:hypothetical protein
MSRRKDMSSKLKSSLEAEDQTLDDRFAKADVALGQRKTGSRKKTPKTQQVVRDTFSMPPADHDLIQELRQQLIQEHGVVLNKSEILRAGLHALQELPAEQRLAAAQSIETLKPGRKAL